MKENKHTIIAKDEKQKETYEQLLKLYGCDVKVVIPQPVLTRSKSR